MARARRPDLILLDLGLQDISGMKVLSDLKKWYDKPVIIISAEKS